MVIRGAVCAPAVGLIRWGYRNRSETPGLWFSSSIAPFAVRLFMVTKR